MELSLSLTLHLFNTFCEYDETENCAQVLEEEVYKMFGTETLDDEQDCNVVSMNSLNTHDANDMQRIHTNNIAIMLIIHKFYAKHSM